MKKVEVMKRFSVARGSCEMVTHLLRTTANRMAGPGEEGPDPQSPWLVPLTEKERRERIIEAYFYSRLHAKKAEVAQEALRSYLEQNDITVEEIAAHGRANGWM